VTLPGRSKEELRAISSSIDPEREWQKYKDLIQGNVLESHSYSFETRVFYDALKPADRRQLLNLYGDGTSPVNIFAIKDVFNRPLVYTDIAKDTQAVIERGLVPFIGQWKLPGRLYTGLSITIDHKIPDADVLSMLQTHNQMYALRLSHDSATYFPARL